MKPAKERFKELSYKLKGQIPFSLHYDWWNEVVVNDWEVVVLEENGEIKAAWPFMIRKKGPWRMICQPNFTPYGGPIFNYPVGQKRERRYSWEQKLTKELIKLLPDYSELLINTRLDLHNTLPFIWEGFEDRKKFTYLLDLKQSEEDIWNGLRENIRRQIRKAEKEVKVEFADKPNNMATLLRESFLEQKDDYPIEDDGIYQRIYNYLKKYERGQFLEAKDSDGKTHAMLVWLHDNSSAYYLIGGSAQEHKNSGAMSLLMWQAIKNSKRVSLDSGGYLSEFNFEGSMIPAIEKYLRGFGGELTPYSCLIKNKSESLKILRKLKK